VKVDPIKPKLKPPGTTCLKLKHDGLLSNFGFKFNLRRYAAVRVFQAVNAQVKGDKLDGRGLHSSTFQLNVSALCGIGGAFRGC